MNRTRTFSWQDPMIGAKAALEMSGLEYLQAIERGELPLPPISETLDIKAHKVAEGFISFKLTPAEYHYNPIGTVHGGVISTLVDSAMACAIHTMLPKGSGYTTLELKVNFLKPLKSNTGEVMCEGKTIYVGGRVATAEARVVDNKGNLYAHATTTCLIIRG
jgi:uncharacterized protein (TIGR00369 family)